MKKIIIAVACLSVLLHGKTALAAPIKADVFLDPVRFQRAASSSVTERGVCPAYRAGVVNHHVLASDLLVRFFRTVKRCRSDLQRIIIISPDHYHSGVAPIVTHKRAYQSGERTLPVDVSAIERLLARVPAARADERPWWEAEHGVGALVSFIERTFGTIKLMPLAIHEGMSDADARDLSAWLKQEIRCGAFVVVSSDMSHYLSEREALEHDHETRRAFTQADTAWFSRASDDYTDNGKAISIVLRALSDGKRNSKPIWRELDHSISTHYGASPANTTSYVTGMWR